MSGYAMTISEVEEKKRGTLVWYGLLVFAVSFYLYSVLSRLGQPLAKDELHWLVSAKSLLTTGRPTTYFASEEMSYGSSPHVYLYSLKTAFDLFGMNDSVARLPGIVSGLVALLFIFLMTKHLIKTKEARIPWAVLATFLYATTPAVIQGTLIPEADNTLLIPSILLVFFSFVKYQQEEKIGWAFVMGLLAALSLGIRITTPPLLFGLLTAFALARKSSFKTKLVTLGTLLCGVLVASALWFLYCKVKTIPSFFTLDYTREVFQYRMSEAGGFRLDTLLQGLTYLILWVGPWSSLLLLSLAIWRGGRLLKDRRLELSDIFLAGGLVILVGYTLIGGLPFGFPKYHSPGLALMFVFGAVCLPQCSQSDFSRVSLRQAALVVASAFLIQLFIIHDPLYTLRYELREAAAFASPSVSQTVAKGFVFRIALSSLLFALLWLPLRKFSSAKGGHLFLILFALGSNMGLCWLQNSKGYQTGYDYGVRGTVEVAEWLKPRLKRGDFVMAPSEVLYYLDAPRSFHLLDRAWNDLGELTRILSDPGTVAFTYSIATHPVDQLRRFLGYEPLQELLHREFDRLTIGSFTVWIRKGR